MTFTRAAQTVLILDDDVSVTEGLSVELKRPGRDIVTCNDLESAELALEWMTPTHVVAGAHITGEFGYEGLDLIRLTRRTRPATTSILMTRDGSDALAQEARARGAVAVLRKPFATEELEVILNQTASAPPSGEGEGRVIRIPLFESLLLGCDLQTTFAPVMRFGDAWTPVAYEAVTRLRTDSPLAEPDLLYEYADRKHLVVELENLRVESILQAAGPLLERALLFMSVHSALFADARSLSDFFIHNYAERDLPVDRIIVEVAEREAFKIGEDVFDDVDRLHELGMRFAIANLGVGYAHFPHISRFRPSFLKVSPELGTGLAEDLAKLRIVANLVSLARDFKCDVILEGVDSQASADAAAKLGIRYVQGSLFGEPLPPSAFARSASPQA
ncbi:MAG: EAL domain-containing protein [Thermoanaerobaculia bacterium]